MPPVWNTSILQSQTSNIEGVIAGISRIYGEATAKIDEDFVWSVHTATLGPVTLVQGTVDALARLDVAVGRHALVITRARSMHMQSAVKPIATIPGARAAMFSPGTRLNVQTEPGQRTSNLTFMSGFLEMQFAALTGETIQNVKFDAEIDLNNSSGALVDQLCQYLADQINAQTSMVPAALAATLCETLSRTLLFSQPHNYSYLLDKPAPPSSRTVVRLVEEYVDAHAGGPIIAEDLARVTGASVLSIEAAFRQHRQTTPLSFLRQRRLQRARRILLEDPSIPTSQVAQMAGFLRLDPFLAAYFKTFQESPSETRRLGLLGPTSSLRSFPATSLPTPELRLSLLSERERQVCALVVQGRLNKQIADELGIAERTVQDHRAHALKKLGVESTAELAKLWERLSK
jgi:DNA-binding CsgD family transcriptional regulator/AraC-like DNA-binding protein